MTEVQRLFLLLALVAGFFLLRMLGPVLTPFVLAGILAYMCDPVLDRLERWRVRRSLGVVLVMFAGFLLLVALPLLLVPFVYEDVSRFAARVPDYLQWFDETAWPWLAERLLPLAGTGDWTTLLRDRLAQHVGDVTGFLQAVLGRLLQSGKAVAGFLANVLLTTVIFGYLLQDWDSLRRRLLTLVPPRHEPRVSAIGDEVNAVLGGFLRGQLLVMLYVAVALSLGLLLLGLDLAIPVGLFAGAITFIPWIGSAVGAVLSALAALIEFRDWLHPALALAIFFLIQQVGDNLVAPRIMGERIGVHPVAIIFAVLAGGKLFGVFGLVLAVPAAAVLKVLGGHAIRQYRGSRLYAGAVSARRGRGRRRRPGAPRT